MNARFVRFVALAIFTTFAATVVAQEVKQAKKLDAATTPASRTDKWWQERHKSMNARVKQGNVDLIFVGDSITHGWEGSGKGVWQKYYGSRNAVNLGIGGDQTSQVLWRLDHGNIDGISPKLAVVMIGTNNSGSQNPEQIARGVTAVVERLKTKLPQTKILLLAIFPRGADNNDGLRKKNAAANVVIAKLADNKQVFYQDLGPQFVAADGTLSKNIMPDLLHPNAQGYEIWAKAIEPMVAQTLGK
jgi:lysophospholipase L1-like esterase